MAASQNKGHGGEARGVVIKGFAESGGQLPGAVIIEQAEELSGEPGGGFATLESGLEEGLTFRDQDGQTGGGGRAQGFAFLYEQSLTVSGIFDELVPVIGAAMRGDFGGAVEEADGGGGSDQRQRPAQGLGRHGIVIEVKADAEGLIGLDRAHPVARERVGRKREQVRFFLLPYLGHGAGIIARPRAGVSDLLPPSEGLTVEIFQGGEGTGGEEAAAGVLDRAFDAAFFIAAGRTARESGEVVVGGEFEQAGMEVDGLAAALQYHTF
jgi:hypothetical protein